MKRTLETVPSEQKVQCPRIDRARTVDEHEDCPYCFGSPEDVAAGRRAKFCDFDPEKDPLVFGFPQDSSHLTKG